ncbi:MAG: hypothetical protein V3V08_06425 [Nannocystaceae bacterium]
MRERAARQSFLVYGLRVHSQFAFDIPAGPAISGTAEVSIRFGKVAVAPGVDPSARAWRHIAPRSNTYGFAGLGRFEAAAGASIIVDALPSADPALIQHVTLGIVMAGLLLQRQVYPLHGNAVRVRGDALGFVGASGAGKSTLAAALVQRDHPLVSDDIIALSATADRVHIAPGIGRLKLFPAVLHALGEDPKQHATVFASTTKRLLEVPCVSPTDTPRLAAVYLIQDAAEISIEPVAPHIAHLQLMAQAFRPDVTSLTIGRGRYFRTAAEIAEHVPVFTLGRPRDLSALEAIASAVESHRRE